MELVSAASQEHGRPVLALLLACLVPREHGLLRLVSCLVRVVWPAILEPGHLSLPPLPPLNALIVLLALGPISPLHHRMFANYVQLGVGRLLSPPRLNQAASNALQEPGRRCLGLYRKKAVSPVLQGHGRQLLARRRASTVQLEHGLP